MPLISEVLPTPGGIDPLQESEFWAQCILCESEVRLHEARVDTPYPTTTTYRCPECAEMLVIVQPKTSPPAIPLPGRSWTFGEWVVRSAADISWQRPPGTVLVMAVDSPA